MLLIWVDWRGIFVVLAAYAAIVLAASTAVIPETLPAAARTRGRLRTLGRAWRDVFRDRVFVILMLIGGAVWANRVTRNAGTAAALLGATSFGIAGLVTQLASVGANMGVFMVVTAVAAVALTWALARLPLGWSAAATASTTASDARQR